MTRRSMPCLFHANLFALGGARWRFRNISVIAVAKMICWVAYFRHLGTFLFCRHLGTLLGAPEPVARGWRGHFGPWRSPKVNLYRPPITAHLYLTKYSLAAGYNKLACGFPLRALPIAGACPGASGMRPLRRSVMCKTGGRVCGVHQLPLASACLLSTPCTCCSVCLPDDGSNSENPITPTSRRSPGPVYLYERRGVYGA